MCVARDQPPPLGFEDGVAADRDMRRHLGREAARYFSVNAENLLTSITDYQFKILTLLLTGG